MMRGLMNNLGLASQHASLFFYLLFYLFIYLFVCLFVCCCYFCYCYCYYYILVSFFYFIAFLNFLVFRISSPIYSLVALIVSCSVVPDGMPEEVPNPYASCEQLIPMSEDVLLLRKVEHHLCIVKAVLEAPHHIFQLSCRYNTSLHALHDPFILLYSPYLQNNLILSMACLPQTGETLRMFQYCSWNNVPMSEAVR